MTGVSASEYLQSHLLAFQNAEKIYSQSVSDVVAAEIRRDEARKQKDEAYSRLEEAREKYADGSLDQQQKHEPTDNGEKKRVGKSSSFQVRRSPNKSASFGGKGPQKSNSGNSGRKSNGSNLPSDGTALNHGPQNGSPRKLSDPLHNNDEDQKQPHVILSPRAGSKKAPSIFRQNGRSSPNGRQVKRPSLGTGVLEPLSSPSSVLELSKGRTREWLGSHLDCDRLGLVRKFYQASFGTKTNQETKIMSVSSIVLNDEWNELVKLTSDIQELYIGKSNNNSMNTNKGAPQTSLRDKAASALIAPQKEPIALFFAPKKSAGTSDLFYAGHWRVIDGQMLDPPRIVKGQPRQSLVKFEFVGVDNAVVQALNEE
jgi:hypothetical protein